MPEYDAFGREIGEDPLAAFRTPATTPASAKPEPEPHELPMPEAVEPAVADPEPVAVAPPPRPQFARPRRRRRRGGLAGLLVLVAIVGGIGLVGNAAVDVGGGIIDQVTPDAAPVGLQGRSLLRHANFADALATLQDADLGRPVSIRVAPDRIDATLIKGRKLHQVQIKPGGELRDLGSSEVSAALPTVAYAAIDPAAPERLTRAGATRKQPARSIDYALLRGGKPITWAAYYKRGRIVVGDRHGRLQRVL